jgi:hypothetical protein
VDADRLVIATNAAKVDSAAGQDAIKSITLFCITDNDDGRIQQGMIKIAAGSSLSLVSSAMIDFTCARMQLLQVGLGTLIWIRANQLLNRNQLRNSQDPS